MKKSTMANFTMKRKTEKEHRYILPTALFIWVILKEGRKMVTLLSSNLMRLTKDKLKEGFIMDLDNLQLNFRHIKDIFLKE